MLVTGGAGLIGSHIVDQLLDRGVAEVRVLDNLARGRRDHLADAFARSPQRLSFLEADLRDRAALSRAIAGCDYVFHQAALRITLCAEQPRECLDVLVVGTGNLFEAAVEHGVRKLVYASSASVYGAAAEYPTRESHHPHHNRTLYGAAKLMNEGMARSWHDTHGLPSVGLRYFNVYGPRMDRTGAYTEVFIRWLEAARRNEPPVIHGDGSASMDCVFVDDVARANLLALESDRPDDVYNVASGVETSLLELWRTIQEVTGAQELSPTHAAPRKVNPVPRRLGDPERAWRELGFRARVTLAEGMRRLADWWQTQAAHDDRPPQREQARP